MFSFVRTALIDGEVTVMMLIVSWALTHIAPDASSPLSSSSFVTGTSSMLTVTSDNTSVSTSG
jgi:hypothetical protein